jgi:hypothetical protein
MGLTFPILRVPVAGASASELSVVSVCWQLSVSAVSELLASIQIRTFKERCVNLALERIEPPLPLATSTPHPDERFVICAQAIELSQLTTDN